MAKLSDFWNSFVSMRNLTAANRLVKKWERRCYQMEKRISKSKKQLVALQRKLDSIGDSLSEDFDEWDTTKRQYDEAMEAVRTENKILREITVPSLEAQHRLILSRTDADIAVQVKKQVSALPVDERE